MMDIRRKIMRDIDGPHGVSLIGVMASPPFSHTIGLTARFGFEVLLVGVRAQWAAPILNAIAHGLRNGESIQVGVPDDRWATMPSVFKVADKARVHEEYVVQADGFYGKQVNVLQLVMPDREGRFPWQAGYDSAYMDPRQPLLFSGN